jgi:predicted small secreted protein
MSYRLKLLIGLIALSSLPALSACNTRGGAAPDTAALGQEGRGADDVEDSSTDRDVSRSGEEEEGTSGQAGDAAARTFGGTTEEGAVGESGAGTQGTAGEGSESTTQ